MLSARLLVRASVIAALGAAGCSAPVIDEEDIADASEGMTQGIVLVERVATVDRDGSGPSTQASVSAKFMRLSGSTDPELIERVVGTRLDLPSSLPGCALLADEVPAGGLVGLGRVVLLDAGDDVVIHAGDQIVPLDRRAFPDVGGAVFGQFYTSRDAASVMPAPARYALESSGSMEMDRLRIAADAPAAPEDVQVADQRLTDGILLTDGASVPVRWRGGEATTSDLVYVDVSSASSGATVRCAFPDGAGGEGSLSGSLLTAETLGPLPAEVTIAVHRVRQRSLGPDAPGIDVGEMRFDLAVVGHAVVEPGASVGEAALDPRANVGDAALDSRATDRAP